MNIQNVVRFVGMAVVVSLALSLSACGQKTEATAPSISEAAITYVPASPDTWLSDESLDPSGVGLAGITLDLKVPKQEVRDKYQADVVARSEGCVLVLSKQYAAPMLGRYGAFMYGPTEELGHEFDLRVDEINRFINDFQNQC